MKKSSKIKLISFSLALLLVLGGLLLDSRLMLGKSETQLEYTYRRALNDLTDYVTGMRSTLKKAEYAATPALRNTVSAKLMEQSGGAKAAMAALPFSQERIDRIGRFLSQVGDYALSLTRKASLGSGLEEKELQSLSTMEKYAGILSDALQEIQQRLGPEGLPWSGEPKSLFNNVQQLDQLPTFDDSLDQVAKEFSEFPSLLYDGPFSDHILRREALFLKDKPVISREEAASRAAKFLGCAPEDLQESGLTENTLSSFVFTWEESRVCVTRAGGEIAYFKKAAQIPEEKLTYEQALEAASKILQAAGISSFRESYYVKNDNQCTINFAYLTEEEPKVLCYPDLVKVTVELGEGGMLEYDATGYLMNHQDREFVPPALDAEEAQKSVSPQLKVKSASLTLIPTPGLSEVLCWEFLCEGKEQEEVLVYINGESGMEEQLYLLQKSENGTLVI